MELSELRRAVGAFNASEKTNADKARLAEVVKDALNVFHNDQVVEEVGQDLTVELLNTSWTEQNKLYKKRMTEATRD